MYLVDVTVVNPEAPSHVNHSGTPLGAAKEAEKAKERKYREAAMYGDEEGKRPSYKFVPFVVETHGALGRKAEKFISALSVNALIMLAGYANSERAFRQ
jgi:hypothetical protein